MTVYDKNFLKSVVFRIDFPKRSLAKFEDFVEQTKESYGKGWTAEPVQGHFFEFNQVGVVKKGNLNTLRRVYGDIDKRFEIGDDYFLLSYSKYQDKSEVINDLELVQSFIDIFEIGEIKRIGLRYINEISFDGVDKDGWDKYINADLLGGITFGKKIGDLSRAMSEIIIKKEDYKIQFKYGFWNEAFPSEILDWKFILDYDCISSMPTDTTTENLKDIFGEYNEAVTNVFESSVETAFKYFLNT